MNSFERLNIIERVMLKWSCKRKKEKSLKKLMIQAQDDSNLGFPYNFYANNFDSDHVTSVKLPTQYDERKVYAPSNKFEVKARPVSSPSLPHIKKGAKDTTYTSNKSILINKPRIRFNGFYSLRTTYTRAPCNDNFWEDKKVESIEVKYYRNFRFFNHGSCLYSLDVIPVWDIPKYFSKGPIPKKVFPGTYTINKREVNVQVEMHYCLMNFKLF